MDHQTFEKIFYHQVETCANVLVEKGKEYATEDRLHNFRVAAALQGCTTTQALAGFLAKHVVSIYDLVQRDEVTMAQWDEKIGDALNYLFLLKAIVSEGQVD